MSPITQLVLAWSAYARRVASVQTALLLSIVYFVVLGPSVVVARLLGAKILGRQTARDSYWVERVRCERTTAALRRQF